MSKRIRQIAVFDLDRTITKNGTFTPFLLSTRARGMTRYKLLQNLLPAMATYKLGRISREVLKDRMLEATFAGMHRDDVHAAAQRFVTTLQKSGMRQKALRAIDDHKDAGDYLVMATASMDFYAGIIGDALGFDAVVATRTVWQPFGDRGALPRLDGENCYGANKLVMLQSSLAAILKAAPTEQQITFYSDHHTDLPVFEWVHHPRAVNPSRRLKVLARAQGIPVLNW